jgi:hypothetical protein
MCNYFEKYIQNNYKRGIFMKLLVQIIDEKPDSFSKLLRKIATEIEEGKICEEFADDNCSYNYSLEENGYHRIFLIYTVDKDISNDQIVLGMAFGDSPEDAFEGFCHSDQGKKKLASKLTENIVIREIIGDPVYK